jgi:hypothetical protein
MPEEATSEPEDINKHYQWIISRHPRWEETKDKIKKELLGESPGSEDEIRPRIREAIEAEKDHDELLQSTISVFDPRGRVCEETGWRVLASEPLAEENLPNADALVGHLDRNRAILVECKTGMTRPGSALEQLFNAAEAVRKNSDYLAEKTGLTIDTVECVLCVPSSLDWRAANVIEEYERDGRAREQVYIWRLNRFRGEILQVYEDIDTRSGSETTHNHELADVLSGDGVRVSGESEVTPAFFPSSHLANIIEVVFAEVLWEREREGEPVTSFTREELTKVLTSTNNLLHYDAEEIGIRIQQEVLPRLLRYGLIEPREEDDVNTGENDPDALEEYQFGVSGRTTETILANLKKEYFGCEVDDLAERMARREAVDRFKEESGLTWDEVKFPGDE